jgi:hypothetical protein
MNDGRAVKLAAMMALLLLGSSMLAFPDERPDPLLLLRKSFSPSIAYTCKVVVTAWRSPKGETALLREWRLPGGRYRIEYLAPKNLRGTVITSDGKRRWRIVNGRAVWDLAVDELTPERLDLLSQNYRLEVVKPATVLNRKAWLVEITPKLKGKPKHLLWLDAEHGIVLKGELLGSDKNPIAFMTVTELKFLKPNEVDQKMFAPPKKLVTDKVASFPLTKEEAARRWTVSLPDKLPFGFRLERIEETALTQKRPTLHAIYTDGLIRVSLFVLPIGQDFPVSVSRLPVVRWKQKGRTFLLVGNLDRSLLERLRRSFE